MIWDLINDKDHTHIYKYHIYIYIHIHIHTRIYNIHIHTYIYTNTYIYRYLGILTIENLFLENLKYILVDILSIFLENMDI